MTTIIVFPNYVLNKNLHVSKLYCSFALLEISRTSMKKSISDLGFVMTLW